jgi:2-amino-4-hydroxy-6-hydroxymethyldihydropteridine diphosphokinase
MMARVGIALGSNLGDRHAHLRAAIAGLRQIAAPGESVLTAAIYQTSPRDCPPGSPDFLNTAIEIAFHGSPHELLEKTRALEDQLGRIRNAGLNAPRIIDIDLLYHGDALCHAPTLVLPHPRLHHRRFVLQPLAEIRPDLVLPGHDLTITELLARLPADEPPLVPVADDF